MAFNSVGQYSPNHKTWDHVGNNIPRVEYSEGQRPGIFKPAEWLPIQFFDKHFENNYVIMTGKAVACDNNGDLVPAGYGATAPLDITYTQADVDARVLDVETGLPVTAPKTVLVAAVGTFLGGTDALTISAPLGVCPYGALQWAGGDGFNPSEYNQHNYNMQHGINVLCDYVLELPLVPGVVAPEALDSGTGDGTRTTFAALAAAPVAANTVRTPITFADAAASDAATRFVTQKATAAAVAAAGDWHIDLATGDVTVFGDPLADTDYTITYYGYGATPASVSTFACAVGDLKCGDFVTFDANSNYTLDATPSLDATLGQVISREVMTGKSLLDRVRTAYSPALGTSAAGGLPGYNGQLDQMPGTASGGVPDNVHYAGAADTVVRINLISR